MKKNQFTGVTQWQKQTFKDATTLSKLAHLAEEIIELVEALQEDTPQKYEEFADCFILLYGAAASEGMSYEKILTVIHDKMELNYKRKWSTSDKRGVYKPIRGKTKHKVNKSTIRRDLRKKR
jgi:NTP pyrophosphatase (non-canonical NTP hydrolase)